MRDVYSVNSRKQVGGESCVFSCFIFVEDAVGISPSVAGGKGFPLSRVFIRVGVLRVGSVNVEKGVGDTVKVASYN
jgi:hypothetical protein